MPLAFRRREIPLRLDPRLGACEGSFPSDWPFLPTAARLYAAESGINAVAVIDTAPNGPGSYPRRLVPFEDRRQPRWPRLIVANAKGFGSGPNGGPASWRGPRGLNRKHHEGDALDPSDPRRGRPKKETEQVIANNFVSAPASDEEIGRAGNPIPLFSGQKPSPIKHLIFVVKENRTFDEIFGQRRRRGRRTSAGPLRGRRGRLQ